jgi:hypothetical protein
MFFPEAVLIDMNARSARTWLVGLMAMVLTVGVGGDAAAKAHRGRLRFHHFARHCRQRGAETHLQLASHQPAQPLGPMRYYGGPKSPMWREAR